MGARRDRERRAATDNERRQATGAPAALRLDRWLWCARVYRSRAQATAAVAGGQVHLNGARAKPSRTVTSGDRLVVSRDGGERVLDVLAVPLRREPAPAAARCYAETAASIERAARQGEARRLAALTTPHPPGRPDKKERRELRALVRRQGRA